MKTIDDAPILKMRDYLKPQSGFKKHMKRIFGALFETFNLSNKRVNFEESQTRFLL